MDGETTRGAGDRETSAASDPAHRGGDRELAAMRAFVAGGDEPADVRTLQRWLRHPFADRELVEAIVARPRLLAAYRLRRDLARHPKTPPVHAMRFVPGLYWRDLVELSLDTRLPPAVRRSAERQVLERLPALSLGERMALARRAGQGLLNQLRHDKHPRVVAALLENPRLTQATVLPLAAAESAPPEILRLVAESRRWGALYTVRLALARNPRTPPVVACGLLAGLRKGDLKAVAAHQRLASQVRRRARLLLGEG